MTPEAVFQKLRTSLRGQTFCPGEPGYDEARTVPNAMIDRRPAMIARCAGAADVIECVREAREHDLLVSVRGGGHSIAGKAVCDDGLMIDMSQMKGIRVDPVRQTVRAQTGLKLGEFDRETQAFGLATTQGVVPAVGIAGLTLGGGWGNLHAKFGLAIDNVIAADVVTAEGRLVTANASENADLFWGIRGGGGNFGIVTSLEYRLHQVGPVYGGAHFFPSSKGKGNIAFVARICRGESRRIGEPGYVHHSSGRHPGLRSSSLLLRTRGRWRTGIATAEEVCSPDCGPTWSDDVSANPEHVRTAISPRTAGLYQIKFPTRPHR
jgi:hypothetical protein